MPNDAKMPDARCQMPDAEFPNDRNAKAWKQTPTTTATAKKPLPQSNATANCQYTRMPIPIANP
jgi:hypothetical protein